MIIIIIIISVMYQYIGGFHRTKEQKVFCELDSIIVQNMNHNVLLFCAPTWPSYHVIENHLIRIQ